MIAYGRNKMKYSLENRAARAEAGCQDFHVKGREETLFARIYDRGLRSRDREEEVRMAMEGGGSSLLQTPVDILYVGGRFAGFLYYDYSAQEPAFTEEISQEEPNLSGEVSGMKQNEGGRVLMVIPVVEAILLTLLVKFIIFPIYVGLVYQNAGIGYTISLMAGGWVPAIAGCAALGLAYVKVLASAGSPGLVAVGCTLAFLAGTLVLLALATIVTAVLNAAVTLLLAALPTIIVAVVIIYIIKTFLGNGR